MLFQEHLKFFWWKFAPCNVDFCPDQFGKNLINLNGTHGIPSEILQHGIPSEILQDSKQFDVKVEEHEGSCNPLEN